ncbi:hypothetical protein D3C81_07110 [compost metagenome]
MIKYYGGVPILITNEVVTSNSEDKYYVSYNKSTRDYGVDTTALVITIGNNEREIFYILKGNHSEQYKKCKNLSECVKYFIANLTSIHGFSSSFEHDHLLRV